MLCFHAVVQVIAYTCDPSWFAEQLSLKTRAARASLMHLKDIRWFGIPVVLPAD